MENHDSSHLNYTIYMYLFVAVLLPCNFHSNSYIIAGISKSPQWLRRTCLILGGTTPLNYKVYCNTRITCQFKLMTPPTAKFGSTTNHMQAIRSR